MDFLIAGWKWPQLDKAGVTVAKKEGGRKRMGVVRWRRRWGWMGGRSGRKRVAPGPLWFPLTTDPSLATT